MACAAVREEIRAAAGDSFEIAAGSSPLARFDDALACGDWETLWTLLNETWIGVPESTSCWSIRGFAEAVALLEDPPEDDR